MRTDRLDRITDGGVIAILRGVNTADAVAVADAVVDAGVTALEITADTPNSMSSIEAISDRVDDALVGAGTVLDGDGASGTVGRCGVPRNADGEPQRHPDGEPLRNADRGRRVHADRGA